MSGKLNIAASNINQLKLLKFNKPKLSFEGASSV